MLLLGVQRTPVVALTQVDVLGAVSAGRYVVESAEASACTRATCFGEPRSRSPAPFSFARCSRH